MIIYENALYQQTEAIKQNNQILSYLIKLRVKILKYNVFLGTLYSKENALIIFSQARRLEGVRYNRSYAATPKMLSTGMLFLVVFASLSPPFTSYY